MWTRWSFPILVLLGIASFSYPIARQVWALTSLPNHWALVGVALTGLYLFVAAIRRFDWQFATRPLSRHSYLCLIGCVAIALVAIKWKLNGVAVVAACFYFGTLIARGLSRAEWLFVRPYGCLLFLFALPVDAARSSIVSAYQQFAFRCTSTLLDAFQVRNLIDGNRIEGYAASVDWSDVATGFWSSSALLAVVSLAIVWQQLRFVHGALMLPLAVAIGMLMEVGRAAFIVAVDPLEWLFLVDPFSFAIAGYLAWVCLCLVRFAFDPIRGKFKSQFVPHWNRRTDSGLALLRLRHERTALDIADTDTCRLPTIEAIRQESVKRRSWFRRIASAARRVFVQFFIFINDWCRSRRYRRLVPLLPIVLVIVVVSLNPRLKPQFAWSELELAERYGVDVSEALDRGDRSRMELLTKRMMRFLSISDSSKFALANALLAIDEGFVADEVLTKLSDHPVNPYAPAQLCLAKRLIEAPVQQSVIDQRRIKDYLRQASEDPLLAPEAKWLLGKIYLQAGDDESALIQFRSIPKPLPETSVFLALIYNRRGDRTAYLRCLKNAENACRDRLGEDDESSQHLRLLLSRSLLLQDRFSDALKILEESPDFSRNPVTRQAAVMVDIAWFDSLPLDQPQERKERLEHAIGLDPTNPVLKKTLVAIAVSKVDEGFQELRQSATGEPEKYEAAEKQYREAIATGFESPIMLNNLAWLLVQKSEPGATEEALELINRAIEQNPKMAELWRTRAEIWNRKGRSRDTIADLEKAIQYGDQSTEVRLSLAKLYDLEGDPVTAQRYRSKLPEKSSE